MVNVSELRDPTYLGDGVYAGHDGYQVWVHTQQGHCIALEPGVLAALLAYDKRIRTPPAPPTEEPAPR